MNCFLLGDWTSYLFKIRSADPIASDRISDREGSDIRSWRMGYPIASDRISDRHGWDSDGVHDHGTPRALTHHQCASLLPDRTPFHRVISHGISNGIFHKGRTVCSRAPDGAHVHGAQGTVTHCQCAPTPPSSARPRSHPIADATSDRIGSNPIVSIGYPILSIGSANIRSDFWISDRRMTQ